MGPVMAEASVGPGVLHDIGHLQHGSTQTLAYQSAPAVFTETHHGEAHHLGAAAGHGGTARQTRQPQHGADGGGGDGQRQCHAHQHGHQNAHQEGLQLCGVHDKLAEGTGNLANWRRNDVGSANADEGGDDRRYQNVDLGLLADGLAALSGNNGYEQYRQRAASTAQQITSVTNGRQGKQYQRRRLEGVADGNGHGGTAHEGGQTAYGIGHLLCNLCGEEANVELGADGVEDRTDQQGAKQTLGHGTQSVNAVPLGGEYNVFSFQKCFDVFHGKHLVPL